MPIVDVELVAPPATASGSAQALADALGAVFGTPPGRTWVRVRTLAATDYAENQTTVDTEALPVFVAVLHLQPPEGEQRAREVAAVTSAVAACLGRSPARVHVQYAPAAAGRQAFGGTLVA